MICSSGIGLDPMVDGQRLMFGFHGIWQGVALLYDRKTQSQWLHLSGECVRGAQKGSQLKRISGRHTSWQAWRAAHPTTKVMAADPRFATRYFPEHSARRGNDSFPTEFPHTIRSRDDRLPLSELVFGIAIESDAIAFAVKDLQAAENPVIHTAVGGVPAVVYFDKASESVAAFDRRLDGRELRFRADDGGLVSEDGADRFDLTGRCIAGASKGKLLNQVGLQAEWYGWYAAYPETKVWKE